MKRSLWMAGLVVVGAAGSMIVASSRWRRVSARMADTLGRFLRSSKPLTERDLDGVPEPAARYFRACLRTGDAPPAVARIHHEGEFRLGGSWKPFHSLEVIAAAPGFVWDARINVAPLLDVYVRDAYLNGTASMQAAVAAAFPVVDVRGGSDLNAGALQRYLAEAPWLPGSLLPRHGVVWEAIDSSRARASLTNGLTSVTLDFTFNERDEIESVYTSARMREVAGRYEPTPWSARSWNYQERCGMRIPLEGEVAWHIDGVPQSYWRGRITSIECG